VTEVYATGQSSARPVVIVTGGARGIGAATCEVLAGSGWDLVIADIATPDGVSGLTYPLATPADLAATADRCRQLGATVAAAICDVRDEDQVRAACDLGGTGLRAAVAVAGVIGADGPAWEQTTADLERDLSVNLHGVANLARSAVPRLIQAPQGSQCRFVAVVSTAGQHGLPRLSSYVAAKHAALGYIRSLAADLGPYGVTANAVLPGSTRTSLLARSAAAYSLGSGDDFAAHQRLQRLIEPAEVAAAVAWLLSPEASGTTGAALTVDGGFVG
jgi:SDR family mycofactocin-dependent oxidoreductase